MKSMLVGIKTVKGVSKKTGKDFNFTIANFTSEFSEKDKANGSVGCEIHTCTVPDRLIDLIVAKNVGKSFEVDYYYTTRGQNIGYAALID